MTDIDLSKGKLPVTLVTSSYMVLIGIIVTIYISNEKYRLKEYVKDQIKNEVTEAIKPIKLGNDQILQRLSVEQVQAWASQDKRNEYIIAKSVWESTQGLNQWDYPFPDPNYIRSLRTGEEKGKK